MAMQIQWAPKYRDTYENGNRDIVPALAVNKHQLYYLHLSTYSQK